MFLVSTCSCLCAIYWSQVLSGEWRCSWSSADRRCSNYIWVINNGHGWVRSPTPNLAFSERSSLNQTSLSSQIFKKTPIKWPCMGRIEGYPMLPLKHTNQMNKYTIFGVVRNTHSCGNYFFTTAGSEKCTYSQNSSLGEVFLIVSLTAVIKEEFSSGSNVVVGRKLYSVALPVPFIKVSFRSLLVDKAQCGVFQGFPQEAQGSSLANDRNR